MRRAASGLSAWLVQRLTAVYMGAFVVVVVLHLASGAPHSYESWRAWAGGPAFAVGAFVFFTALLAHAWVGVRDVVLDYVKPIGVRIAVLAAVAFGLLALEAWVVRILLVSL
jgi:succinate dehydrogenase / fumarate reductase membrane anchor subunit